MTGYRLPIVIILCVSTLVTPARTSRGGVIEVAVQAAKSPPAKWFAGFAATYFVGKGADWTWDQITGKPKIDELNRKITETEARYPAYRVYFEALRVNINANTDQLTFEHSIADVVRKIDEDAAAASRLKNNQAPAQTSTSAPALPATFFAGRGLLAPGLNPPFGSSMDSLSASGMRLSGARSGSMSTNMVRARVLSPSEAATALLNKTALQPLANPIVSPYGADSNATPLNSPTTRWGLGAVVAPTNPLHSPYGLGASSAAPTNAGASPALADTLLPSAIPLHSPYGSGSSVLPWTKLGAASLNIGTTVTPSIPGYTLPVDGTTVTPAAPADSPPAAGNPVMPWDPRYDRSGLAPR